ncbi:hypothetical protein ACOME3_001414 [Neoechinorhynchus agilis]
MDFVSACDDSDPKTLPESGHDQGYYGSVGGAIPPEGSAPVEASGGIGEGMGEINAEGAGMEGFDNIGGNVQDTSMGAYDGSTGYGGYGGGLPGYGDVLGGGHQGYSMGGAPAYGGQMSGSQQIYGTPMGGPPAYGTFGYGPSMDTTGFGGHMGYAATHGESMGYSSGFAGFGQQTGTMGGAGFGTMLPLNQYQVQNDPNPIIIKKQYTGAIPSRTQKIKVRYLRAPTPPPAGPIIVKEVREPMAAQPPPVIIKQKHPSPPTPPPLVLRERPPPMPSVIPPKIVTKTIPAPPPPKRQVIIHRCPKLPAKPRDIIIERWIPYDQQVKRKVVYQKAGPAPQYQQQRNMIIQWDAQVKYDRKVMKNIVVMDPDNYLQQYGHSLLSPSELVSKARSAGVHEDLTPPRRNQQFFGQEGHGSNALGNMPMEGGAYDQDNLSVPERDFSATEGFGDLTEGYQSNSDYAKQTLTHGQYYGGESGGYPSNQEIGAAGYESEGGHNLGAAGISGFVCRDGSQPIPASMIGGTGNVNMHNSMTGNMHPVYNF